MASTSIRACASCERTTAAWNVRATGARSSRNRPSPRSSASSSTRSMLRPTQGASVVAGSGRATPRTYHPSLARTALGGERHLRRRPGHRPRGRGTRRAPPAGRGRGAAPPSSAARGRRRRSGRTASRCATSASRRARRGTCGGSRGSSSSRGSARGRRRRRRRRPPAGSRGSRSGSVAHTIACASRLGSADAIRTAFRGSW